LFVKDKIPKFLERSQVKKLIEDVPENSFSQHRDKLVIKLMVYTGLRVSEALSLKYSDVIMDRRVIRVIGKGNKEREIPVSTECMKVIEELKRISWGANDGCLVVNKSGRKLSSRYLQMIIKKCSERIFGKARAITPHVLRHTFASTLRQNGAPIEMIQRLLGHRSIVTTCIYLHIPGKDEREQLEALTY